MTANRFTVLMYHNLAPTSTGRYSLGIDDFRAELSWLRAEGYIVDGFRELRERLIRADFPDRYVVATFDDGHKSNVTAARILREFDAQATFFITRDICQTSNRFMDDDEIVEVGRSCSVGSHGVTHRPLSRLAPEELRSELVDSKSWLENLVGYEVESLSAPGGWLDARVVRQAREAGYELIGNSIEWWNHVPDVAARRIVNRVEVGGAYSLTRFKKIVRGDPVHLARRRLRCSASALVKRLLGRSRGLSKHRT